MSSIERVDERGVGPINVGLDDFAEGSGLLEALVGDTLKWKSNP